MKNWQRQDKFGGWVLYERCVERIVVQLPKEQDGGPDPHRSRASDSLQESDLWRLAPKNNADTKDGDGLRCLYSPDSLHEEDVLEPPSKDDAHSRDFRGLHYLCFPDKNQDAEDDAYSRDFHDCVYSPDHLQKDERLLSLRNTADSRDLSHPQITDTHHINSSRQEGRDRRCHVHFPDTIDALSVLQDSHRMKDVVGNDETSRCATAGDDQSDDDDGDFLPASCHTPPLEDSHPLASVSERRDLGFSSKDHVAEVNEGAPTERDTQGSCLQDNTQMDADDAGEGEGEGGDGKAPTLYAWYLVDADQKKLRLPRTMLFLGRDECDIIIQSGTVDKRHAVITFDLYLSRFKVKDLSTTNGTYVNESRIPEQEYVTLNHMDTIRLGYDSKVYYMEQGEPCGDSPPPPPLPLQPPPSLTEVANNRSNAADIDDGDIYADAVDSDMVRESAEPDAWGMTGEHACKMAECQGCIAEQRIEHTCTHAQPGSSGRHHHHHHSHHDEHVQRKVEMSNAQPEPEPDLAPEKAAEELDQQHRLGRNTWPRKKVRQVAHVSSIFDADGAEDSGDSNLIAVESGSNYFVSVDDSVCDGGRLTAEYNLSRAGSVQRILRNSKQPLPPELATVKKGTPLYGQPSWWGEDTESNAMDPHDQQPQQQSKLSTSPRPSSLLVDSHHHQQHYHPRDSQKAVYMEIPHHVSTTPERDKAGATARDKTTPARSVSSSLSKDSLILTSDSREKSQDRDYSGGGDVGGVGNGNPALSFTVDFGDDEKKPKLKTGASLSQFVPTKIRNSLSRSEKLMGSGSGPSSAAAKGKESSGGSRKNSEERELSPTRQKRFDDLWGSDVPSKGKPSRRSSGQATGVPSLRTADFSSESAAAPVATERSREGRKEGDVKRVREAEKELDKKPPKSPKSQDTRKSSPRASAKITKSRSQTSAAALAASVHAAQYSDPTAYLIDRMFAGTTGSSIDSPRSDVSGERERSDSPASPEHAMYKEARDYDYSRTGSSSSQQRQGSSTYRAEKPLPKQQKSFSKSKSPTTSNKSKSPTSSRSPANSTSKSPTTRKSPASNAKSPASNGKSSGTAARKSPGACPKSPKSPRSAVGKSVPKSPGKPSPPEKVVSLTQHNNNSKSSPPTRVLPVAPSPIGGDAEEEDKVSEAGTYTIEADEDGTEELIARQKIDEVFGVDVDSFSFERPVIGYGMEGDGQAEEEEAEKTLHEDDDNGVDPGSRTPCGDEDYANVFDDEEPGTMSLGCGEEEVPSWINQLNALTAASLHSPSNIKGADKQESKDESNKKGQGQSRKRPGTGRKLPSIPSGADQSPISSEHSSHLFDNSPDSPGASAWNGSVPTQLENGLERSTSDSPTRNVKFSSQVSGISGKLPLRDSPSDVGGDSRRAVSETTTPRGGVSSVVSRGSIDTEILLRDTETVMAAMEARMGFRQSRERDDIDDDGASDEDLTSNVALVNGDDDYVKPTKYHSPRETMARMSSKDKENSNIRIASNTTSSSHKVIQRSLSEQKPPPSKGDSRSARSGAGISVVSDVLSRNDSLDQSFQSDISDTCSDRTDNSFSRSGSRGKGTISMTKPNRAFALRRARADGTEEAARGGSNTSTPASSARRSSSIHGTSRTPHSDRTATTGRTETSLGGQIVRKARENNGVPPRPRESSATRGEAARRNSLKGNNRSGGSATSSSASFAASTTSSAKKDRDIRTLRTQLKSSPGSNKDLAITGISSRSQSQPGSRSNSPKAAERMAWKRRKEYDPRKAVADAKANKSKEPRPKPKVQASNLYKQRMIRSASFTNSVELSGRVRHDTYNVDSTSSVEDLSSAATATDSCVDSSCRRAFIPFHNPLRGDRLFHSADEDEAGTFPTSQSYDSLIVSSIYQLSLKLKTTTDRTLNKLREQDRVSITPSPIDDFLSHPTKSEIPAWKSANQELAGVLKNLRKMEHHLHLMERALFPDEDADTDVSGMSVTEKHKYFQEIERIRNELAGFQPIDTPQSENLDPGSPEMAELSRDIH